jgi:hypothetical protein
MTRLRAKITGFDSLLGQGFLSSPPRPQSLLFKWYQDLSLSLFENKVEKFVEL